MADYGNEFLDINGVKAILCPSCGEESDVHPAGYVGHSDLEWAEAHWNEVDGKLYCSAYCAALGESGSEEDAIKAATEHSKNMRDVLRQQRIEEAKAFLEAEGVL